MDLLGYDKVEISIERMRQFEPEEGFYAAFSGGKDSTVVKHLADRAGVKYDAHFSNTGLHPPELLHYIKEHHQDVIWEQPKKNMWTLILENRMPPMRNATYCCRILKEGAGLGRLVMTGVRAEESARRKKFRMVEMCNANPAKRYLHPIIDWTAEEVWQYIKDNNLPYCSLYDEGFKRVGCCFCPMAYDRKSHVQRFPNFYRAYIRTFQKVVETGKVPWKSGQEMVDWWLSNEGLPKDDDMSLFS